MCEQECFTWNGSHQLNNFQIGHSIAKSQCARGIFPVLIECDIVFNPSGEGGHLVFGPADAGVFTRLEETVV